MFQTEIQTCFSGITAILQLGYGAKRFNRSLVVRFENLNLPQAVKKSLEIYGT